MLFDELDISLVEAVHEAGFTAATPVQEATLEAALDGKDLFVSAETGSGKTAAYLLPTFEQLIEEKEGCVRALVIVPTRELAQQVLKHAKLLGRFTEIRLGHIGGGTDIHGQMELVQNPPQFLVATPGRLSELMARGQVDLSGVEMLILDEADRLLDMGFSDEIMAVASACLARRQTQLYSATLANKALRGLAHELLNEPEVIELSGTRDAHENIQQQIIFSDDYAHKEQQLAWLLDHEEYQSAIVFCNSKDRADHIFRGLQAKHKDIGILHGDCDQKLRNRMMSKLRRKEIKVLIATDLVSRGIDIEGLDLVINYEMPRRGEIYVHRIGRTGRAGEKGLAITLIAPTEFNLMSSVERFLKQRFERRKIKELAGNYSGPKKLKASGKAAGKKKKKPAKGKANAKKPAKKKK